MQTEELIQSMSTEAKAGKAALTPSALFLRWFGGSAASVVLMLFIFGLRPDLSAKLMDPLFLAELVILSALMICLAFTASCLSFPDMYQKRWVLWLAPLSGAAFLVTLVLAYIEDSPPSPLPIHGIECLLCIMLISLTPAAWMFMLLKKQASTHLKMAGSTALLAAISIGALTLRLVEETDSVSHLITWHYLPMVGFALLGTWLGQKILKW